jgi:hypothetical protein
MALLGSEDRNMKLDAHLMTVIIYGAIRELHRVTFPDILQVSFNKLEPIERRSFEDQTLAIIDDPRIKPAGLHDKWYVTTQKLIADGALNQKFIARLNPYMIPFRELAIEKKTEIRLHLQMARTLIRHNRNVERDQKRQRQR